MALTLSDVGKKKTTKKKASATKTTTAVKKKKKVVVKKAAGVKKFTDEKKVRPWQTPEEVERIEKLATEKAKIAKDSTKAPPKPEEPITLNSKGHPSEEFSDLAAMQLAGKPLPKEVVEILQKMEGYKKDWLSQLPPEISTFIKGTWVNRLQVYPKIKIPMPGFLVHKEKNK